MNFEQIYKHKDKLHPHPVFNHLPLFAVLRLWGLAKKAGIPNWDPSQGALFYGTTQTTAIKLLEANDLGQHNKIIN